MTYMLQLSRDQIEIRQKLEKNHRQNHKLKSLQIYKGTIKKHDTNPENP